MDVDLDELIKRAHTPNFKNHEYNVSVQPTYLSIGYPVYNNLCYTSSFWILCHVPQYCPEQRKTFESKTKLANLYVMENKIREAAKKMLKCYFF